MRHNEGVTFYERMLRPLLFRWDAETAHNAALQLVAWGLIRGRLVHDPRLRRGLLGMDFPNPLGLAAGVDKEGRAAARWAGLGFGFAEVGTLTALPQSGNPRPRLFRVPEERAIINRMGFNNAGASRASRTLASVCSSIPLGINLGKSKVTPLADAARDYADSYRQLAPFASYVTVNVSSPNTPGLRDLQSVDALSEILDAIDAVGTPKPIFVKLAPDLQDDALRVLAGFARERGLAGLIATNTTSDQTVLSTGHREAGGISGAPLRTRSNQVLRLLAEEVGPDLALIGVGGIFTGDDLHEKLSIGADLAQVYTGWVYGGPGMVGRTLLGFLARCEREGVPPVRYSGAMVAHGGAGTRA